MGVLLEKTKGNLSLEEQRLLENSLTELRFRFVQVSDEAGKAAAPRRLMAFPLKITVLGSGTSVGVPTIGCHCDVCTSSDPRDNRLRPSILVSYEGRNVLVDTTPDFRTQALRANIERVDAILFTHAHADHIMGLDDVRPFNFRQKGRIPIYAAPSAMEAIRRCFQYVFEEVERATNVPKLDPQLIDGAPFDLFGLEFTPVPVLHGAADHLRVPFRRGGLSHRSQRDP